MTTWHPDMPMEYRNQIVTGDARVLAERIPDESVDLIFTDPVYDRIDDYRWLAETAARVLRLNGSVLVWTQTSLIQETLNAMSPPLRYRWQIVHYKPGRVKNKFGAAGFCQWEPLLWFDLGNSKRLRWRDIFQTMPFQDFAPQTTVNHRWSKNPDAIAQPLSAFPMAEITVDFYAGSGTLPAVCKMLGRNYVAFEIEPDTAELARQRVVNTQPPLFVPEPEQKRLL